MSPKVLPERVSPSAKVAARLLYEADHTCCICRKKHFDVQIHHFCGRNNASPANLIVLCLNCHSDVGKKGGLGRVYSAEELKKYKHSWVREVAMRRRSAKHMDQSLVLFELRRLTYSFNALGTGARAESSALKIMGIMVQYARDFGYEVKEECISFVYDTASWILRGKVTSDFVFHETAILLECLPIGAGGLVARSRKPLGRRERRLLSHCVDVAGEIAYTVCKYVREKEVTEQAVVLLHDILRFTNLNGLSKYKDQTLWEFSECERICNQKFEGGQAFTDGLELLESWKKIALS